MDLLKETKDVEGMVHCKNMYNSSSMTDAWEISHNGNLFGKPWSVCMHINQTISVQRLFIHKRNDEDYFVKCTKLGDSWHHTIGTGTSRNRTVEVNCPNRNNQTICMNVSFGRKDDIGLLQFEMTDGLTGKTTDIYSEYFIFKDKENPHLIPECIDRENREITIDMDFVDDGEFGADAYYNDIFLCKLHRKEWESGLGLKNSDHYLACKVDYGRIERIKHERARQVTVIYTSEHVHRNVTTYQVLQIKDSCPSKSRGSNIEVVIPICIAILVLLVLLVIGVTITCFIKCKRNRPKFNKIPTIFLNREHFDNSEI